MNKNEIITRENSFIGEKYYLIKHSSGLDIYVFPKELTTYYALFAAKYGSVDNKFRLDGDTGYTVVPDGIAHFLEHKMFENENGEDTFERFARTGANANAYTSFRNTAYLFSCTDRFYDSLEILLDFVTSPYFTPATVEKEQGIIGQEIRMGEDNPNNALIFGMLKALYEKHPVRIEIAGTVKSISHITAEILYKCYNAFYNLNNMALCVCGKAEPEKVIEVADKILKKQPDITIKSVYPEEKPQVASPRFTNKMQVSKPLFAIGIKDTDISPDPRERMVKNASFTILCEMLFGKSSDFYNRLYEEGLISRSFGFWFEHNEAFSFISLSGDTDDPDAVFARFCEYTDRKNAEGLSAGDFERCKRVMYANLIRSFDSTEEIANNLLINYVFDGGDIFEYIEIVKALSFDCISTLSKNIFKKDYYALATILPVEERKEN